MNKDDIKKLLYKQKPTADWKSNDSNFRYYQTNVTGYLVVFAIPNEEANGFEKQIPAQLLIRWLEDFAPLN